MLHAVCPRPISANPAPNAEPSRQLGLSSATPAGMARALGSPMWLLIVWLVMALMTVSGALCYGELVSRFPRAGGSYVYLREAWGSAIAFLYGWMCLLVMDPGLTASFAVGISSYIAYVLHWPALAIKIAGVGLIWVLCISNIYSLRISAGVLRTLSWLKLGLLAD